MICKNFQNIEKQICGWLFNQRIHNIGDEWNVSRDYISMHQ